MVRRVVIVGAGPAGVRCAEALVAAGLRPTVIDENRRDGGQIYRRQPENFTRSYDTLYGTEAHKAAALHNSFDRLREHIDYLPETLVWNIAESHIYTATGTRQRSLAFDALVLCTGAADRLMPVNGWNLAGAYSLGGAQVALKSQACAIGRQIAFVGTGALLYLVAAQYVKAGANVVAVIDTSARSRRVAALGKLLAQPSVLWKGVALEFTLRRAPGLHIYAGAEPLAIVGAPETGVQGLVFRDDRGREHRIECDAVGLGYHLRPETQLADIARCEFRFDAHSRQWLPKLDADGRTSVPGVYIAGDGARVLGANAAETSGKLAALAVLQDMGCSVAAESIAEQRRTLTELARFAQGLAEAFPWPAQQAARLSNDTIVCRCESVTAGELRGIVEKTGASEANRAKAFSRVGMGRCQGRYCGHAAAEIIAHAAAVSIEDVGRLRGQAPVKPLPIAILSPLPVGEVARSAGEGPLPGSRRGVSNVTKAIASDVIIVGGGIMGTSAAFFLRQRGCSVTLIERGLVGQQASGVNFGNVRRQGRPLTQLPLANRASLIWRQMKELLGEDVEYIQSGHIRVCYRDRPEAVGQLEQYARDAHPLGLELELLSAAELHSRFPFLGPEVLAGSLSSQDGHANPRLVAPAFARAAQRNGAAIFEHTHIVHAEKQGEDFLVTGDDGRVFRAPILLIATGAWGNQLSAAFGEPVDLISRGPTMSVTEPVPYCIRPAVGIFTPAEEESVYFRQIPRGNVIIGGSYRGVAHADACRAYVKPEHTLSQLKQVRRVAPALQRLNIIRVWTGIEGYPPDNQPVMGASDRVSGLYYAFGFSGAGFQIGPGVGETMAELIATGATGIALEPYRIARFDALTSPLGEVARPRG